MHQLGYAANSSSLHSLLPLWSPTATPECRLTVLFTRDTTPRVLATCQWQSRFHLITCIFFGTARSFYFINVCDIFNLVLEPQSRLKRLARTKVIKHFLFLIVRQNAGSINMSLTYQRGYKLYFKNKVLLLFLVVF